MNESNDRRWLLSAAFVGLMYAAIGVVTGSLAAAASSPQMVFAWRLSAFIVSGLMFIAHVGYEHFRLRNSARRTAWHTSLAVAFGAFLLAVVANIHDLNSATGYRLRMLIALEAWPLLTGVPAFVAALIVAGVLALLGKRSRS